MASKNKNLPNSTDTTNTEPATTKNPMVRHVVGTAAAISSVVLTACAPKTPIPAAPNIQGSTPANTHTATGSMAKNPIQRQAPGIVTPKATGVLRQAPGSVKSKTEGVKTKDKHNFEDNLDNPREIVDNVGGFDKFKQLLESTKSKLDREIQITEKLFKKNKNNQQLELKLSQLKYDRKFVKHQVSLLSGLNGIDAKLTLNQINHNNKFIEGKANKEVKTDKDGSSMAVRIFRTQLFNQKHGFELVPNPVIIEDILRIYNPELNLKQTKMFSQFIANQNSPEVFVDGLSPKQLHDKVYKRVDLSIPLIGGAIGLPGQSLPLQNTLNLIHKELKAAIKNGGSDDVLKQLVRDEYIINHQIEIRTKDLGGDDPHAGDYWRAIEVDIISSKTSLKVAELLNDPKSIARLNSVIANLEFELIPNPTEMDRILKQYDSVGYNKYKPTK